MAIAELANISERRVEQLVNPALSSGLTPFLAPQSGPPLGLHDRAGGGGVAREREQGALPPRERRLHPLERGARGPREHGQRRRAQAREVVDNVRSSLAIELLTAAAGIDQRAPLTGARLHTQHLHCEKP
jgi:histidine ammonia-lyase